MKEIIFLIFAFVLTFTTVSQNQKILVQYHAVNGHITNTESLIATKQNAIYITDSLYIENEQNANIIEEDEYNNKITISQKTISLDATKYYLRNDNEIVYFTQIFKDEPSLVKDSLPKYTWDISKNETKKIGNYLCQKASTNFRGSEIIAWYAEEINIPYGPWKFKGLPGLILELYTINDTTTHIWRAQQIIFPYSNKDIALDYDKNLPIIQLETVVIDMEIKIKEQMKRFQTRIPKGVRVSDTKLNRTGIEKEYEWEN